MENFKINYYPGEIAETLYNLCCDMDQADYGEQKAETLADLENTIYFLMATAQNKYNNDYFRTFYRCLENIAERNI